MSKKKKNQAKKVLSSFAHLGNTGKNTLSRLATTVKADMPTVLLGNKDPHAGTIKTDGINLVGGNRISRVAKRLNPFKATPAKVQAKPAAARLKHIAGKMGHAAMPKTRKSKGVIWLFAFFLALSGAGYYGWTKVEGLGDKMVAMVDYKSWLDKASGKVKPESVRTSERTVRQSKTPAQVVKQQPVKKSTPTLSVTTKTVSIKKVSNKASVSKKAPVKSQVAKSKAKPKAKQKQEWESRLAKLKKKSEADYRRASHKYRSNHK